jgi:hypothetical protein
MEDHRCGSPPLRPVVFAFSFCHSFSRLVLAAPSNHVSRVAKVDGGIAARDSRRSMSSSRRIIAFLIGVAVAGGGLAVVWPASTTNTPPIDGPRVVMIDGSVLGFPGATDWRDVPCSDVGPDDLCQGQWRHESGQVARVLLLPLPDPSKLDTLAERLQTQTRAAGGIAERIDGERPAIRLLQPMRDATRGDVVIVGLTYVVTAPDGRSLHLLTSSVPLADQEAGDRRLRDLLAFGAWLDPDAP